MKVNLVNGHFSDGKRAMPVSKEIMKDRENVMAFLEAMKGTKYVMGLRFTPRNRANLLARANLILMLSAKMPLPPGTTPYLLMRSMLEVAFEKEQQRLAELN